MFWWIVGILGAFFILRSLWRTYCHPANVLGRQAANMNWVASRRIKDEDGFRNVCVTRDNFEAIISYKHENVILNQPNLNKTFNDFIELEHWISKRNSSSEAEHEWKNEDLAACFIPKPNDPIWKAVTNQTAELIQQGFLEIWRKVGLDKYKSTDALPPEVIDTICEVANKVGEKHNLNPAFIILITHQYVDADQLMRQIYRTRWVAFMVDRWDSAPPPESYMKYIKATYFAGDE